MTIANPVPPTYRNGAGQFTPSPIASSSGEKTGAQTTAKKLSVQEFLPLAMGAFCFGHGGDYENPLCVPGWNERGLGTTEYYRWMLKHPILQLVRSIATGPIRSSSWDIESAIEGKSLPENQLNALKTNMANIRSVLIDEYFIRGRDYGWASGEVIWEYRDGIQWIRDVKPLNHNYTDVLLDPHGRTVGLRNSIGLNGEAYVDLGYPYKAFLFSYDTEYRNPYGRSWLENVRDTSFKMWWEAAQQMTRIASKISGTVTIVTSPSGSFPGPAGADGKPTEVSYRENALAVIQAMAKGAAGAWFPSIAIQPDSRGSIDAMKLLADLVGKSMTNIQVIDHSGNSSALMPLLSQMTHAEELMFAGGLRSSRTGLEGSHGTKAEAGIHTDTGTVNAESDDEQFARIACQPLVDAFMVLNFGEKARGTARLKPAGLIDRKGQTIKAIATSLLNNQFVAEETANSLDMNQMYKHIGLPMIRVFNGSDVLQRSKDVKGAGQGSTNQISSDTTQSGRPPNA